MELFGSVQQKDIVLFICSFLNNKDKIHFLSICKFTHGLKQCPIYKDPIDLGKILKLNYYEQFTNIRATRYEINEMKKYNKKFPNKMTSLALFTYKDCIYKLICNCKYLERLVIGKGCRVRTNGLSFLSNLKHLIWDIEQKIYQRYLPQNLVSFELGENPHPDCYFPDTIEELIITEYNGYDFTSLKNLKKLVFTECCFLYFFRDLLEKFPANLKVLVIKCWTLIIDSFYKINTEYNIPHNLQLVLNRKIERDLQNKYYDRGIAFKSIFKSFENFIEYYQWKIIWTNF